MAGGRWAVVVVASLLVCLAVGQAQGVTRVLEVNLPFVVDENSLRAISGFVHLPPNSNSVDGHPGEPSVYWLPFTAAWHGDDQTLSVTVEFVEADTLQLPLPLWPAQRDQKSSDTATVPTWTSPDPGVYESESSFPMQSVRIAGAGTVGSVGVLTGIWCPMQYAPLANQLIVARRAFLTISDDALGSPGTAAVETTLVGDAMLDAVLASWSESSPAELAPSLGATPSWSLSAGVPLGVEYVIVTKSAFVNAVKPLALWKARRGVNAGIATVEEIVSQYSGVDAAESVREYLKAAYARGLKWVVIGGDETVAPVRRAYAEFPAYDGDPYKLQQCDLYFAELNGNWDADGDGIWGEFFGDQAQTQPELYVGRLPYSTAAEATAIVNKIIEYERGPAQTAYLTKSLSVSTDQFRDWNSGVGQHGAVAQTMPSDWSHDLSTMIEAPTGDDPAPLYPEASSLGTALANGVGWVNYYVHGRADGFVVRSAGIMEWPRAYVFTNGSGGDGNAYLNLAPASTLSGIHLSAACDQGGFDLNSAPYSYDVGESVAEKLLFMPGGAVAFVGQSRWGWVSTSFMLVQKFYEYVGNGSTPNHVGVYQTLAKLAYSSYRDLVFGNNLYGDPQMPVWKSAPLALTAHAPETFSPGTNSLTVRAVSGSSGVPGAVVTISVGDSVWMLGQSGSDGTLTTSVTLPSAASAILTVSRSGYRVWADTLPVSIISGIFDDGDALPSSFLGLSNYPNPFNAATVLTVSLTTDDETRIEVFDVLGRRVRVVADGRMSAGDHRVVFDGTDDAGRSLASGVYFARISAGAGVVVRKIVLVR